jgi:hypothetical protein
MRRLITSLASLAALSLPIADTRAQCGGQGSLVLELVSVGNSGTVPGSEVKLRLTGKPNQHVCLACDTGRGPVVIPGFGIMCLDASPGLIEFVFFLPASGFIEFTLRLPSEPSDSLLCCQAFGFDRSAPNGVSFSNSFCFKNETPCVSGGFKQVGYITKFTDVTSFPVRVTSSVHGRAGGSGDPETTVVYDPANPPSFPVSDNPSVFVENIVLLGTDLYVTTFVEASPALTHNQDGRLPNELDVTVVAGGVKNGFEGMHVSCSQPFAVGMVFGPFTITFATPFRDH